MNPLARASRKLVSHQTLPLPSLGFVQAVDLLEDFNTANLETPRAELPAKVAADAKLQDAAVAFFAYRFTAVAPQPADVGRDLKLAAEVAQGVLRFADPTHRQAFLEQVVFNVAHPAGHQALAPVVKGALPAAQVERALLTHARSTNPLHLHNALELPRWVFGSGYPLSEAGRAQLERRVEGLRGNTALNPLIARAVTEFRLPATAQ
ncbi:MAG: hypothetical protein IPJ65_25010 [Archangiaceae bacterium]|nr:hypothetical protein [Archangiaceae bacterium]